MTATCRVFGTNEREPSPAAIEHFLSRGGRDVDCYFQGDDLGWFRAELIVDDTVVHVERYLVAEEGIRAELNTWAAWVESRVDGPEQQGPLLQHLISTRQLFVLQGAAPDDGAEFCQLLAGVTEGLYQVDGQGLFAADGRLLVAEEPE